MYGFLPSVKSFNQSASRHSAPMYSRSCAASRASSDRRLDDTKLLRCWWVTRGARHAPAGCLLGRPVVRVAAAGQGRHCQDSGCETFYSSPVWTLLSEWSIIALKALFLQLWSRHGPGTIVNPVYDPHWNSTKRSTSGYIHTTMVTYIKSLNTGFQAA